MTRQLRPETLAVRAGQVRSSEGEQSEPIFLTSSFTFDSAAQAAARFSGDEPGNIYSRFTNPTVRVFEDRLAALEGGDSCVATASGMSAILATCMALLKAGDHVVCSNSVFGTTVNLFDKHLTKFGIEVTFVDLKSLNAWDAAVKSNTKMFFVETPSNPLTTLVDLPKLADIAHSHKAVLVVDNCFCTPVLQQPLKLGADIVVHSATKYLDGQGRAVGGAVVGDSQRVGEDVLGFLRSCGPTMSAFNAWIFLKGLETLSIRMAAHDINAMKLATWLDAHPQVANVYYPGLASHPQHELAKTQQSGFGGLVSFDVKGGREQAWHVVDNTDVMSITANLGDTKTTITHPGTTTHSRLSEEQRAESGIKQSLLRVSVGLESVDDIIDDLAAGLDTL